jgi:DNA-binding winged helix-turn-helix (wHTH) protein
VDSETRELTRDGQAVHLSPKSFRLLELLLAERPRALSKEELHEKLWPATFVSDTTLTGMVAEIRAAIGDDARAPRFIRTIPAFGYAFSGAAVEQQSAAPTYGYRLLWRSREVALHEGQSVLGRGPESTVWIDDESVSRSHARIEISGSDAVLSDLGSKNGTFVGDKRLTTPVPLADGDEFRLGDVVFQFRLFRGAVSTRSGMAG